MLSLAHEEIKNIIITNYPTKIINIVMKYDPFVNNPV
jgi:hypothetical protein